jgi:type II secretory pathway pseudopilin PulG
VRGLSLVVAMVMLAAIGLLSAAVMRAATGASRVADAGRLQAQAVQLAQAALRACERQLTLPASTRAVAPWPAASTPAWTRRDNWTGGGARPAHALTAAEINAGAAPRAPPQCLVEATATPAIYTVTARGFSADFAADPATGAARSGSVAWLQSTVLLDKPTAATPVGGPTPPPRGNPCTGDCAPAIVQRVWQQLLTPPF